MKAQIRKIAVHIEETHREMGRTIAPPTRKAVAVAVIANPFAGIYQEDLTDLMDIGAELGDLLGRRCVEALGITPAQAQSYGKSAMVGEGGELEHAAAILHPKLGAPLRAAVEKGAALVPSSKKMGSPGQVLDVPLGHKDAAYVRSHFDGIEVSLNDAPRANEIMVAVAVTDSGRPLPRVGGLTHTQAEGKDGLREVANYKLDDQVGYLLRLASQRHAVLFQQYAPDGITPTQFSTLIRLAENGSASQNQLGRMAGMDVATIKGVVDRLRQKGLVKSKPDPQDKRRALITLTAQGRALIPTLQTAGRTITEATLEPLSAAESDALVAALRKVV